MVKKKTKQGAVVGAAIGGIAGAVVALPTAETASVITVPAGIALGGAAGATLGEDVEVLIGETQKLVNKAGKGVEKSLRQIQRSLKKHSKKQRRKDPSFANYINLWVKEIDKRLKMGKKEYMKLQRQARRELRKTAKTFGIKEKML